jgi:hypothetical protein
MDNMAVPDLLRKHNKQHYHFFDSQKNFAHSMRILHEQDVSMLRIVPGRDSKTTHIKATRTNMIAPVMRRC